MKRETAQAIVRAAFAAGDPVNRPNLQFVILQRSVEKDQVQIRASDAIILVDLVVTDPGLYGDIGESTYCFSPEDIVVMKLILKAMAKAYAEEVNYSTLTPECLALSFGPFSTKVLSAVAVKDKGYTMPNLDGVKFPSGAVQQVALNVDALYELTKAMSSTKNHVVILTIRDTKSPIGVEWIDDTNQQGIIMPYRMPAEVKKEVV
jgi:hypothetical protein